MVETAGYAGLIALRNEQNSPVNPVLKAERGFSMSRSLKMLAILGLTTLALSACGVRGPLEAPKSEGNGPSVQPKAEETPHRSNPLDGLLR